MRIVIKLVLCLVVLIIALISQAAISESGNSSTGIVRLIPGAILIFGCIGVWRYKPETKTSESTDLDKRL